MLAEAYAASGRPTDAVTELRKVTELAPRLPGGWYALGHAYNAVTQDALAHVRRSTGRLALAAAARRRCAAGRRPVDRCLRALSRDARAAAVDGQHSRFGRAHLRADGPRRLGGAGAGAAAACRPPTASSARRCASSAPGAIVRRSPPRWPDRMRNRGTGARAPRPSSRSRRSSGSTRCPTRASGERCAPRGRAPSAATPTPSRSSRRRWRSRPAIPALLDDLGTTYYWRARLRAGGRHAVAARQGQPRRPAAARAGLRRLAAAAAAARRGAARAPARRRARAVRPDAAARARPRAPSEGRFRRGHSADRAAARRRSATAACTCSSPARTPVSGRRTRPRRCSTRSQEIQRAAQERGAAAAQRTITPPK